MKLMSCLILSQTSSRVQTSTTPFDSYPFRPYCQIHSNKAKSTHPTTPQNGVDRAYGTEGREFASLRARNAWPANCSFVADLRYGSFVADLRYVDPLAPRGAIYRAYVRLAGCRFARWLSGKVIWSAIVWKIDPYLLRLTKGRLGTGLLLPTALLQTRGARTGLIRRNAVIYFHDGERVTIIASKAGRTDNPSWFYNLRANPDVLFGGQPFRAKIVEDDEQRAQLWQLADRVFPAFAAYRNNAALTGRTIPIVQLLPER